MRSFLLIFLCFMLAGNGYGQTKDETAIRTVLNSQVAAWNAGNIKAYMAAGYWQDDSLVFIGKNGPKYGYSSTLANYQKSYPDTVAMGRLSFELISLERLSPTHYFAIGKWWLRRSGGDVGGSWTLLFRKINGHWKVVVDHSS